MCSGEEWNGLRGPNKTLFSSLTCLGGMQPWSWTPIILGNLGNFLKSSKPHLWNEDNKSCPNWVMRDFEEIIHAQCMPDMSWIFRPQQICQQLLIEPRLRHLVPSSQGLLFWLFFLAVLECLFLGIFVTLWGLSPVAASKGYSSLQSLGFSLLWSLQAWGL